MAKQRRVINILRWMSPLLCRRARARAHVTFSTTAWMRFFSWLPGLFASHKSYQWLLKGYVMSLISDSKLKAAASSRIFSFSISLETRKRADKLQMWTTFQSLNHITQLSIIDWGCQMGCISNGLKSAAVNAEADFCQSETEELWKPFRVSVWCPAEFW